LIEAFSKRILFVKNTNGPSHLEPQSSICRGSGSAIFIIRKQTFVGTSILAISVAIAKYLFHVYAMDASGIFLHLLTADLGP
jgi:hypothetical protein